MRIMNVLVALALCGCGGKQQQTQTTTAPTTEEPTCTGHMANGQCHTDLAAACAALGCQPPQECISLESAPPQAECRTPPQ